MAGTWVKLRAQRHGNQSDRSVRHAIPKGSRQKVENVRSSLQSCHEATSLSQIESSVLPISPILAALPRKSFACPDAASPVTHLYLDWRLERRKLKIRRVVFRSRYFRRAAQDPPRE